MFRAQFGMNKPWAWTQQPKPPFIDNVFQVNTNDGFKQYEKEYYISKLGIQQLGSRVEVDHTPAQSWTIENYKFE